MIYFFCFLLLIALDCGKSDSWHGSLMLASVYISLIFAILCIGGYL